VVGRGSGSSSELGVVRSSRIEIQRLKSGRGDAARALRRILITTSGLWRSGLNW
jgi:hypothetical protein